MNNELTVSANGITPGNAPEKKHTPPSQPSQSQSAPPLLLLLLLLLLPASFLHAAEKPVISRQPAGATYSENAVARFQVNASSVDGGYLTYQWYRSSSFGTPQSDADAIKAASAPLAGGTAATLITTTPTVTGTEYYYYWVIITNHKDGDSDFIESAPAQTKIVDRTLHTSVMQGDFLGLGSGYVPIGAYWNTTHDGRTSDPTCYFVGVSSNPKKALEIYPASIYGTYSNYDNSNLVAELSCEAASSNYQDVATVPGRIYEWSLYHSARRSLATNPQVMAVVIGPAINMISDYTDFGITDRWIDDPAASPDYVYPYGRNYTTYFYDILNNLASDLGKAVADLRTTPSANSAPYTTVYGGNTYYVYISSDTNDSEFVHRSGVYTVPAGQGTTVFGFVPITLDNGYGNLIDDVFFASGSPLVPAPATTYSNEVSLSTPTKDGYIYGIAEVRGSSVSLVQDAAVFYDPDDTDATSEVAISKTAGLGIDGWYSTYGSSAPFSTAGIITFKNLVPGKTYRIVGIPLLAVNDGLHVNETPEYVLDEGYYKDIQAPPANEGTVEVDSYMDGPDEKGRVSVKNARSDVEYALLANNGSGQPVTSSSVHDWTAGTSGYVTFDNLALDTWYYLVARPYGYDEVTYADAAYDADGTTPVYIRVKTPGTVQDIDAGDVSRLSDCRSIVLQNSKTNHTYAVVDPETGLIIGSTLTGTGGPLTFTVPDASKTYQIVTKSGDVNSLRGVRVYGCPDDFFIDYLNEAVKSSHDATGNIPTGVEYYIRGNDAGLTPIVGDANDWTPGIGTQPVNLAANILAGNTRSILDSITSLAASATLCYRVGTGQDGYTGQSVGAVKEIIIPQRPPAPTSPVNYTFDWFNEQITVASDSLHFAQIAATQWTLLLNGASWTFIDAGWDQGVSARPFNVRIPATDIAFASSVRTDTIPVRPPAPSVDLTSNISIDSVVITNMLNGVNYQYYTSLTPPVWTTISSSTTESDSIAFAPNATCYVRLAATTTAPASFITVLASPISIQPVFFATYAYGATPVSQHVIIRSTISTPVDVTAVVLDGTNAEHFDFTVVPASSADKQVPANGTNTKWELIPDAGLNAGTYDTRLKMTYMFNGTPYEAFADVYLTVGKADWDMSAITGVFDVAQTRAQQLVLNVAGAPPGAVLAYYYGSTPATGNPASPVAPDSTSTFTFTAANGLQPSTAHSVSVLAQEDVNHNESTLRVLATGYTAYATPVFADVVNIDYINERLTFVSGYSSADYTLGCASCTDAPVIASPYSLGAILDDATNTSLEFWIVHNAGVSPPYPASETGYSATVTGRPAAPAVDCSTVTHASGASADDGSIHVAGQFGYRIHGTPSWSSAQDAAPNLGVGDYDVRRPVTAAAFASQWVMVTVSAIVTQPAAATSVVECCIHDTLSVAIPATANAAVGYQWYSNTVNSSSGGTFVDGATSRRFPVPTDLTADTYYYYCEITLGGCAMPASNVARVTVVALSLSKQITSVTPTALCPGGDIRLEFSGGTPYEVHYTVDDGVNPVEEHTFTVTESSDTTIVAGTPGDYTFLNMLDGYACSSCAGGYTVQVRSNAPDALPVASLSSMVASGAGGITMTVGIVNSGGAAIWPPVYVTLYRESVSPANVLGTGSVSIPINPGGTGYVPVTVADVTSSPVVNIVARVNDNGTTFPYQAECDTSNNRLTMVNARLSQFLRKDAEIQTSPAIAGNGTYANPVSVFNGERIRYTITAVNPAAPKDLRILDTLPPYLNYVSLSSGPQAGVTFSEPIDNILTWRISGMTQGAVVSVTYDAIPAPGSSASQPLFINSAWVLIDDAILVPIGNSTYHQGAGLSMVTFSAAYGGSIYNSDPQAVDYSTAARTGVLVVPDEGYRFTGWSHDAYISHRGKSVEARSGIARYDTLAVYADVELTARFEPETYPIRYHLHDGENASANPPAYTVESGAIALAAPRKTGDVFTGWTGSNGDALQETVTIPAGSTGGLEYYANYLYSGREDVAREAPETDKIWSSGREAYIHTTRPGSIARIYTPDGILRRQQTILSAGTTKIRLAPGVHIVTLNNGEGRKIVISD